MPIHPRSPWSNKIYKKYCAKQISFLEATDVGTGPTSGIVVQGENKVTQKQEFKKHLKMKLEPRKLEDHQKREISS